MAEKKQAAVTAYFSSKRNMHWASAYIELHLELLFYV